jgi:hypothetical protein
MEQGQPAVVWGAQRISMSVALVVGALLNGIATGMIYALMGIGLALILGLLNLPNFAHGVLYSLGAYFLLSVAVGPLGFWAGLVLAPPTRLSVPTRLARRLCLTSSLVHGAIINSPPPSTGEGAGGGEGRTATPPILTFPRAGGRDCLIRSLRVCHSSVV